jgi:hypothetical protein
MPRSLEIPDRWIAENILCYRLQVNRFINVLIAPALPRGHGRGSDPGMFFRVSRSVACRYRAWVRKDGLLNVLLFLVRSYKVLFFEESARS